jgi:hypothetical protein
MTPQGVPLDCTDTDPPFTFENDYVHNDGNTIGQAAVVGAVSPADAGAHAVGTYPGVEFHFDSVLPKVPVPDITLAHAKITLTAKRAAGGSAAVIVNGVGISSAGFVRSVATDVVEEWDDTATDAFNSWYAGVSTAAGGANINFDLMSFFGADKVRTLVAQGKLNVTLIGNLVASAQAASATRTRTLAVSGPELLYDGTYVTRVCTVPDIPGSPLTENGVVSIPDEYEDVVTELEEPYDVTVTNDVATEVESAAPAAPEDTLIVVNDGAGPVFSSIQAAEITSTSATIYWLTDEPATTQVFYGIGSPANPTAADATPTTFHSVHLTGLSPYKYYQYVVLSTDKYGNASTSGVAQLVTLR